MLPAAWVRLNAGAVLVPVIAAICSSVRVRLAVSVLKLDVAVGRSERSRSVKAIDPVSDNKTAPSVICPVTSIARITGAFVFITLISNVSDTVRPKESRAVTVILIFPSSPLEGVPEKVRVDVLKVSQEGRGSPPSSVAEYVSVSPASTSEKVVEGTT